jgi:hypothetical protein
MEIGKEQETIIVEPIKDPFKAPPPPAPAPDPTPAEPAKVPA